MSGLVGTVIAPSHEALAAGWIAAAAGLVRQSPLAQATSVDRAPACITSVSSAAATERLDMAEDESALVFVAGALSNGSAATLLRAYHQQGARALDAANGTCLIGVWDARERTLHLQGDRIGVRKLYYAVVPGGLLVASQVKALLAHPEVSRAVDAVGLAHFLALGYVIGDHTLYGAVRLVPGGTRLRYRAGDAQAALDRYWTPRVRRDGPEPSLEAAADDIAQRLDTAVSRQLEGARRPLIPLSAGFDSRTLLGFIRRARPQDRLNTVTIGHGHSYDVVFGRRLAALCRTRHRVFTLRPDFMARDSQPFVWRTDGMISAHNCWSHGLLGAVPDTDRIVSGFLGDALSGSRFRDRMEQAASVEELIQVNYPFQNVVFSDLELGALLRPRAAHQAAGATLQAFGAMFRDAEADELVDRAFVALMRTRQARYLSYMPMMLDDAAPVATPFTDADVVDGFLRLPYAMRRRQFAYLEMIKRHLPGLSRVPTSQGTSLHAPGWWQQRLRWRWDRVRTGTMRWLGVQPHDRDEYAHYGEWMRREPMRSYLQDTLTRGEAVLANWVNPDVTRRVLARHMDGAVDAYRQLSALLTLVLWFEQAAHIPTATAAAAHE